MPLSEQGPVYFGRYRPVQLSSGCRPSRSSTERSAELTRFEEISCSLIKCQRSFGWDIFLPKVTVEQGSHALLFSSCELGYRTQTRCQWLPSGKGKGFS